MVFGYKLLYGSLLNMIAIVYIPSIVVTNLIVFKLLQIVY